MTRRALVEGIGGISRWRIGLAIALLAASVALLVYTAAQARPSEIRGSYVPPRPGEPGTAATTDDLLVGPDVIVVGTVRTTEDGRTVGDPPLTFRETLLDVEQVLAGTATSPTLAIESESEGVPFDREWRRPGTRVVAFLWLKRDEASGGRYYRLISQEGAFTIEGLVLRPAIQSAITDELGGLSVAELTRMVQRAREP